VPTLPLIPFWLFLDSTKTPTASEREGAGGAVPGGEACGMGAVAQSSVGIRAGGAGAASGRRGRGAGRGAGAGGAASGRAERAAPVPGRGSRRRLAAGLRGARLRLPTGERPRPP